MKDKQTIEILISLSNKYPLTSDEKEAISNAVGILSWSMLSEGRVKKIKAKRDRDMEL